MDANESILKTLPILTRRAQQLTGGRDWEDLVNDAVVSGLRYWEKFAPTTDDPQNDVERWMMTIMRNLFLSRRRLASVKRSTQWEDYHENFVTINNGGEELVDARRAVERISDHPVYADLIARVVLGDTYEDVAARAGVKLGTIKSRVSRAREHMRGELHGNLR